MGEQLSCGGWIWFETIWRSSSRPSHGRKTRPWIIPTIYIIHLHAMPSLSSLWLIWHHYHHLAQNIHNLYILRSNLTSYNQILHSPNKSVIGLIPLLSLATQGFSQDWSKCFLNIELSFSKFQFDDLKVVETHKCVKIEISPSWPHPHTFEMCPKCRELLLTNEFQLHVLIIVVQKVWADVILWWLAFSKYHLTCARKTP